jgi:acetoin utilization deacetylase AcuC-like enzyme
MAFGWPARRMGQRRPTAVEAQLGYYSFAADCSIGEHTWAAALASAALAQTAASVVAGGDRSAFARCRPPGHHAGRDIFGGYCYLNNAAIAAEVMRQSGVGRVGILDVDYHHGNGTQDIFYEREDVVFCSIHADPATDFPYFLGYADEQGWGAGEGRNRNISMPVGTDAERWLAALDEALAWLELLRVEALVVSLGVDTFVGDPISHFTLGSDAYPVMGERIGALGLPSVFVLEGGYASDALGQNVVSVLAGFAGS